MNKIKFTVALSIIFCMNILLSSTAFAVNTEDDINRIQIDTPFDRLNPDDYIKANEALVARGKVASLARASKTLDVTHYYQSGEYWSVDIMDTCGSTIGSAGCCLTSFTMIQRYLGGIYTPRGVNMQLGNAACPFEYTTAATIFDYTIDNYKYGSVTDAYARTFIIGAIDSGLPVLVGLTPDDASKNTHFVTAYGYSGSTIYIHDPASGRDYTELSEYLDGYSVHRLYVYSSND
jgi:hypothetical protein